jgi:hypothetical protein
VKATALGTAFLFVFLQLGPAHTGRPPVRGWGSGGRSLWDSLTVKPLTSDATGLIGVAQL